VAWEGTASPFRADGIFPKKGSFLDSISLVRQGGAILWEKSIHPLDKRRVRQHLLENKNGMPFDVEYRLVDLHGAIIWIRHTVLAATQRGAKIHLRGFVREIQAEKELELESLRISEREQNRIGQDLHDDLCQVLAGVSCLMRVMEGRIANKVPEEVASIAEINHQVIEAMQRTRALTHGLFPGKIQIADVRGALLELASQVRARFQVEVKTQFTGRFPQHSPNQIIQIYRLTQEAISNAIKHGRATRVDVQLEAKSSTMFLSISDNGSGLENNEPSEKGVGMHIMRYRTRTLGGDFSIRNGSPGGVVVQLRYPFEH
jgi:signal transduction histidine kinase